MKTKLIIIMAFLFSCKKETKTIEKEVIKTQTELRTPRPKRTLEINPLNNTLKSITDYYYTFNRLDSFMYTTASIQYVAQYEYIEDDFRKKTFRRIKGGNPIPSGNYVYEQLDQYGNVTLWTQETSLGEVVAKGSSEFIYE